MASFSLTQDVWTQIIIGGSSTVDQYVQVVSGKALISIGSPTPDGTAIDSGSFDDNVLYVPAGVSVYARPTAGVPVAITTGNYGAGQSTAGYQLAASYMASAGIVTPPQIAAQRAWQVKRGLAASGKAGQLAKINVIGDSTNFIGSGTGAGADGGFPFAVPAQLVKLLNGKAGRTDFARCDGWWGNHYSTGSNTAAWLAYDTRWTAPSWIDSSVRIAGGSIQSPAANTSPITLSGITIPYDRVRVIYTRTPSGGTLTVASASGGSGAIATAGATATMEQTVTVTRGTGNLTLTPAASTAGIFLIAIEIWDSTVGQVIVRDMSYSGATAVSFGQTSGAAALLTADFANYCFTLNDAAVGAKDAALFSTELQALIGVYSAGGGAVSLFAENESSGAWNVNSTPAKQRTFAAAIRALGASANYPVIDLPARWGDYATANANGLMYNDPHPNYAGHYDKALLLANAAWA